MSVCGTVTNSFRILATFTLFPPDKNALWGTLNILKDFQSLESLLVVLVALAAQEDSVSVKFSGYTYLNIPPFYIFIIFPRRKINNRPEDLDSSSLFRHSVI